MQQTVPDPRIDRLYNLLPAIYRMRDAGQGYPLQALLRVMAEQVNVIEDDIRQLYDNWFIETAQYWAVPYIADLIGYEPVLEAGLSASAITEQGRELNRALIPRREIANTIRDRRRKGCLATLEQLAQDVAAWPARAVEFFKLLAWHQNIDHPHLDRARTVDVRKMEALHRLDGPFDSLAHTVDIRRINAHRTRGRYNIPSVGVFIWRLKCYSVTYTPAYCEEGAGPNCATFSVLGCDAPLFVEPQQSCPPRHPAGELNVPSTIGRLPFSEHPDRYYGAGKSFAIYAEDWAGYSSDHPIPVEAIIPADLTDWVYEPPSKHIAVDPVLGRMMFPAGQLPRKGIRVSYHYGFSADMGGGEYIHQIYDPSSRNVIVPNPNDPTKTVSKKFDPMFYLVGKDQKYQRIGDALRQWQQDNPWDAVLELTDSGVYVEPISIDLGAERTLQLRAANGARPVLRLLDWQTDMPDSLSVKMAQGSRFVLDGVIVTGRPLQVTGPDQVAAEDRAAVICASELVIRHCTLVPGWGIDCNCEPKRPAEAGLELYNVRARVCIEHSILGTIQVVDDEVHNDPIPIYISDSIVDSTAPQRQAIGGAGDGIAFAILTIERSTIFGIVETHAIKLAENSIFTGCLNVARRQLGCMRFCYVPFGCRTPRRYYSQPDLVTQKVMETVTNPAEQQVEIAAERVRVAPQFTSNRYGNPGYAQLSSRCAVEIVRGAEDESEMGAFHDLFQPQRQSNLQARLEQFTPAGMDVGIIFAD